MRSRRSSSQPVRNRQPLAVHSQLTTDSCMNQENNRLSNKNGGMDLISAQKTKEQISNPKRLPNDDAAIQQLRKLIRLRETIEKFQRKKLDNLNADISYYDKTISSFIILESQQQKNALLLIEYYEKIIQLQKKIRDLYQTLETLEMATIEEASLQRVYPWNDLNLYKFDAISFVSSTETRV